MPKYFSRTSQWQSKSESEKFIQKHQGMIGNISVYGQESNPTTWRLAAMNMAIRGIDFNFGKEPAGSFTHNQHPDLRADFVIANPPFNISDWGGERLEDDVRWKYGIPPKGNANFAWVQHFVHHLEELCQHFVHHRQEVYQHFVHHLQGLCQHFVHYL